MGGNALKETFTRRYSASEYHSLIPNLLNELQIILNVKLTAIKSYKNKPDFGDADILIENDNLNSNWKNIIIEHFQLNKTEYFNNGNVFSFVYKQLQIDLISVQSKYFNSSFNYYSNNDLGNLLGRLTHKLGIKYGHTGLSLIVRPNNTTIVKEIQLETNNAYEIILRILGLQYTTEFNNLEDIFNFVASSKYFDPNIFLFDNQNHINRIRNKKRKTYNQFLTWINETQPKSNYDFKNKTEFGGHAIREPFYSEIILKEWPWVQNEVNQLIIQYQFNQDFKKVFNGHIINSITGLKDKELGHFIQTLNTFIDNKTKIEWINNPEKAIEFISVMYRKNQY